MGFDAFGLPAENAAISRNIHPKAWTYGNIERMRRQLRRMGAMIDWRREAVSCDPEYYQWTQWFFLRLLEKGLAYRKKAPVDWCPGCNTTIAREQVVGDDRRCERCAAPVIRKDLVQWFFLISRYADQLLDFSSLDWPERVKILQTNWIGRSEGASVLFRAPAGDVIPIFTTRPDTLWGVTFLVLAPEHPLIASITTSERRADVSAYLEKAQRLSEVQREALDKEKTGVFTGSFALNPVNGEQVPIWVADYVLMNYGTGAIMAVPAHDQRDFEFARKYGIEIRPVILEEGAGLPSSCEMQQAMCNPGTMVNSGALTGTASSDAFERVARLLEDRGIGRKDVVYRLRDWLISRQRYWGAPIPVVHCPACGIVPVPESDLPVLLPDDVEWRPTGESPLKLHQHWKTTQCPRCKGAAERETDTMDTFVCSCWYHLRYLSPHHAGGPFDPAEYQYWMPVDTYTGGVEHATMHLIYTRFFHKAGRDLGIVSGDEPMTQLRNQGIILGEDFEKMSKSRGNVVAPDDLVDRYGADAVRAYLMFVARWEQGGPWNSRGIIGASRWLHRVWKIFGAPPAIGKATPATAAGLRRSLHSTLRDVTADFEAFQFNTAISALMQLSNEMQTMASVGTVNSVVWEEAKSIYIRMLAPIAPHMAEELWLEMGRVGSVHLEPWPQVDDEATLTTHLTIPVQVDGKLRDRIQVESTIGDDELRQRALAAGGVQRWVEGRAIENVIVKPGRLVNIVVSPG